MIAHIEFQHKTTFDNEVALVVPKVEDPSTDDGNVSPIIVSDPLYVAVEDEKPTIVDAQCAQDILMDVEEDGLSDFPADEFPIEK